jgi:hypothetical protein
MLSRFDILLDKKTFVLYTEINGKFIHPVLSKTIQKIGFSRRLDKIIGKTFTIPIALRIFVP